MAHVQPDLFRRLCAARELLREVGDRPLTVEEVARRVAVSRFHFIRRFEEVFGATPSRYRTLARVARAKRLLARGESSVTEACMEAGFKSLGSFSSLFTRRVGCTPSAFLREARALAPSPGVVPPELEPGCLTLMGRLPPSAFRNPGEARPGEAAHAPCSPTHNPRSP